MYFELKHHFAENVVLRTTSIRTVRWHCLLQNTSSTKITWRTHASLKVHIASHSLRNSVLRPFSWLWRRQRKRVSLSHMTVTFIWDVKCSPDSKHAPLELLQTSYGNIDQWIVTLYTTTEIWDRSANGAAFWSPPAWQETLRCDAADPGRWSAAPLKDGGLKPTHLPCGRVWITSY